MSTVQDLDSEKFPIFGIALAAISLMPIPDIDEKMPFGTLEGATDLHDRSAIKERNTHGCN